MNSTITEFDNTEQEENEFDTGFSPDKQYKNLPKIVIAGRPNVGKSTLFNRLLHKRRAITDPTPGVTRDPIEEEAFINGYPVRIMDTGGFKLDREIGTMEAVLDELVVEKSLAALKEADCILLLLEADTERRQIRKTRYCLMHENQYFEIDIYPFWNDKAILEIELSDENSKINFPENIKIIKEVTDDENYKNASLAKINN